MQRDDTATKAAGMAEPQAPLTPPPTGKPNSSATSYRRAAYVSRQHPSTPTPNSHDSDGAPLADLSSPSPQQEPGSAAYLARLLRHCQCLVHRPQPPKPPMADFLASFDLGAQTPAQSNNLSCSSVQDVQLRLRGVLDAKTTLNRAEHVSITLELKSPVVFTLVVSENENGVLEGLNQIDPSLGGLRSTSIPADHTGGQLSRVVEANETLLNQPQDNPVLQRSVAKHIITAVSATDGSVWTVREVSRSAQGWIFTYLCKDSCQQWNRQNSKNPAKAIVGEYSQREPDQSLSSRPAFDCRGTVVISFNRSSRSITIKYEHTPLHKTVAQLAEYFKPPPRQLGPGAQRVLQQKTPKKAKEKKARRESTKAAQDENGNPRRKKKKNNDGGAQVISVDGPVMPPDYPGAPSTHGQGQAGPSYTNGANSATDSGQNPQTFNDYPQGLMGHGSSGNGSQQQPAAQQAPTVAYPVKVSPAEAVRRRQGAITMLSNAGVNPDTLSIEQLNIFSNQSPDLQKESLNMLVKYGAERLRIVHPSHGEGSVPASSNASAASTQSSQPTPSGPMTTKELVPQSGVKGTQDMASVADDSAVTQEATPTTGRSKRGIGKSRTACFSCKARKVKCPKERPICAECLTLGTDCEYAPQKPRSHGKKANPDAVVIEEDEDDDDEDQEHEVMGDDGQVDQSQLQGDEQDDTTDYSLYNNMPVATMLTPSAEQPVQEQAQPEYFQSASGLALPRVPISRSASRQDQVGSGLDGSQNQNGYTNQPQQAAEQQPVQTPQRSSPRQQRQRGPGGSTAGSRRSLPTGPTQVANPTMTMNSQPGSDWPAVSDATMQSTTVISPQTSHATTGRQRTRQSDSRMSTGSNQIRDGVQQATSLSQAALNQQPVQSDSHQSQETMQAAGNLTSVAAQPHHSPTVTSATQAVHPKSPFQQAQLPRTGSRQSQRSQSRTPVTNQSISRGFQPPPSQSQGSNTNDVGQRASDLGMSGFNDYGRYQPNQEPTYNSYPHQRRTSHSASARQTDSPGRNAAIAMSMSSQPPSTMATSYAADVSAANQWSSSSQGHNTRSFHHNTTNLQSGTSYSQQPSSSSTSSASLQNFSMRGNNAPQQSARSDGSLDQQHQQNYPAYSSQGTTNQQHQGQPANQHQNWNYFSNTGNSTFAAANQSSNYSWKMPDEPWSGV